MILNKAQKAVLDKAVATANFVLPLVEYFEKLAQLSPQIAERANEMRVRREHLYQLATSALDLDNQVSAQTPK